MAVHVCILSDIHAVHTEPVLNNCTDCGRMFRTYVANSMCHLPDGGVVSYKEPQLQCPLCDEQGYGVFMNQDLFPELKSSDD